MPVFRLRCSVLAGLVGLLPWTATLSAQPASSDHLRNLSQSFVSLTEKLTSAVVRIKSDAYGPASEEDHSVALRQSTGSGVILTADGYIVTNAHVVSGATRVQVQLARQSPSGAHSIIRPPGRLLPAKIVGIDRETDLAVLKIQAADLPFLSLGDSDKVRPGQIVLAMGNPLGLESSVSMGVVSAVARQVKPDSPMVYLQTDAPINPGNSGGPLIDVEGNVVGINAMILSQSGGSEGLGLAIPSNIVKTITEQLRTRGLVTRGEIGVHAQTITPVLAEKLQLPRETGVILADVEEESSAEAAGLKVGDIVLSLDGKPMENARQLQVNLYRVRPETTVKLEVLRDHRQVPVTVVVTARTDDPDRFMSLVDKQLNLIPRLGILGVEITGKVQQMLPTLRHPYGILVASETVSPNGPSGMFAAGDILYALNNRAITGLAALNKLLEAQKPGETVVLQVERDGQLRYLEVPLD